MRVIILGSGNAIADEQHDNTHMVLVGRERTLLIDCASHPIQRLQKAQVGVEQLTDMILTHFHPDHVAGAPLLLMDLWLMGRKSPLNIYGPEHTISRFKQMMDLYLWDTWPGFFEVKFFSIPEEEKTPVFSCPEMNVYASPVKHFIPTLGIRVDMLDSGKSLAYSCDTEPCPQVIRLADKVDILIHEATGASTGHTSPAQAGEIARSAWVKHLYLIHYPSGIDDGTWVEEARNQFSGQVTLAHDFQIIEM
jgi:ribonuclease Z